MSPGITVLDFGADPTGHTDASQAFQKAINSNADKVVVPAGKYRIDHQVEVKGFLFLESGVHIFRGKKSSHDPLFWLSHSKAVLKGEHKGVLIESASDSPDGIIKIGHHTNAKSPDNILFCEVKNLNIKGNNAAVSKGVQLQNNQEKGDPSMASYFHNLNNLLIEHVGIGIHLFKMSNANSISQIYFNRVGRGSDGIAILIEGAMENRIYDCFHHFSPDAVTLRMQSHDNLYPMYNYIYGIVAEQGGADAVCLDVKEGLQNILEINCNTAKGHKIFKDFYKQKNSLNQK